MNINILYCYPGNICDGSYLTLVLFSVVICLHFVQVRIITVLSLPPTMALFYFRSNQLLIHMGFDMERYTKMCPFKVNTCIHIWHGIA